jgi:hypothetical protein
MRWEENIAGDCKRSVARHLTAAEMGGNCGVALTELHVWILTEAVSFHEDFPSLFLLALQMHNKATFNEVNL